MPLPQPQDLLGLFVVEVGERQAWPFVQFCDNSTTPEREVRLYIDTTLSVVPTAQPSTQEPLRGLLGLNSRTVAATAQDDQELRLTFEDGTMLSVSGDSAPWTTHDVWWFTPWLAASK